MCIRDRSRPPIVGSWKLAGEGSFRVGPAPLDGGWFNPDAAIIAARNCLMDDVFYFGAVSYTHLRAHETPEHLVCRLLLEKKKKKKKIIKQKAKTKHIKNRTEKTHKNEDTRQSM